MIVVKASLHSGDDAYYTYLFNFFWYENERRVSLKLF